MVGKRDWKKIQLFDNKKRLICSAIVNYEKKRTLEFTMIHYLLPDETKFKILLFRKV